MKGGKTSFCHSLLSEFIQKKDPQHNLYRATYFTYEEGRIKQLMKLMISFMNRFHRNQVEGKDVKDMDPAIKPHLKNAHDNIADRITLMDMSGTREGQGHGGPAELLTCIDTLHRAGRLGQLVVVDHVLPLVRAHIARTGRDAGDAMRHEIGAVCKEFVSVCSRLNVTGVLAHQMDAKGNKSNPSYTPSHMDSAECKHFAELLHDTMCIGTKDQSNNAKLNLSATRTGEPKCVPIRVRGERCRIELATGVREDPHTGALVNAGGAVVDTDESGQTKTLNTTPASPPTAGGDVPPSSAY